MLCDYCIQAQSLNCIQTYIKPLASRAEHRSRRFTNRMLKKISGPKKEVRGRRKLHNEELHEVVLG
jgi:hypothetical protein